MYYFDVSNLHMDSLGIDIDTEILGLALMDLDSGTEDLCIDTWVPSKSISTGPRSIEAGREALCLCLD